MDRTNAPAAGERGGLIAAFVDRPVLTAMVALAILVLGTVSLLRLPLRFLPAGMSENQISVWIPVPGDRSPEEVQDKVVQPLEQMLRTIAGLQRVRTWAGAGSARITVRLDEGMDPTLAAAEVRDRIQRAMLRWPEGVDRYFTWKEDGSSAPLAFVQFLTPSRDSLWDHLMDQVVRPRLEAVDGVGRVDVWGLRDESIRIWFDRDRLLAHRVDLRDLLTRLGGDNFAMPVGELDTGRQSFLVRVDNKFRSTAEIEAFPVRPGLRLGEVATVERRPEVRDDLSRYNGQYTYTAMIRAAADANPVQASDGVRAGVAELQQDPRMRELNVRFLFDQGQFIREGLENLVSSALQGGVLALLVLWLFSRSFSMTGTIAFAIPLTLLLACGVIYFTGDSLNISSMAGLTLAVGMVVDNSVVVLENVRRLRRHGASARAACIAGAREVRLPVTIATLTTVAVFLPIVFLRQPALRAAFGSLAVPLAAALLASLLVALLLMPSGLHAAGGGPRGVDTGRPPGWLHGLNQRLLHAALRHRLLAVLVLTGLLVSTASLAGSLDLRSSDMGPFRPGEVAVHFGFPRGYDLADAEARFREYESYVEANRQRWEVANVGGRFSRHGGRIDLFFTRKLQPDETERVRAELVANWPRAPGVRLNLGERRGRGMGGAGRAEEEDDRNFVLRLYGRDSEYLMQRALELQRLLRARAEVESVDVPAIEDNREILVGIDRERLQELGVRPEAVFGTIATGLQGRELGRFEESGREVRVVAQFDARLKPSLLDLKETRVMADGGAEQRLADLGAVRFERAVEGIESQDGRINVVLVGRRQEGLDHAAMRSALQDVMRAFPLPTGYSWSEEGVQRRTAEELRDLMVCFALGLLLVFFLMAVLFESLVLPFAILFTTVPMAFCGAIWSLWLFFGGAVDSMAIIGIVVLGGIVVNNGIVLLDYIRRLRQDGRSRTEAILEGVRVRLRPIFVTATTTCVGLLPMALFGERSEGLSYVGLSIAVSGGLAFCTVLTAVVVPLGYTLADDITGWFFGVLGWLRRRAPGAADAAAPRISG